jgi:hypothetical protein
MNAIIGIFSTLAAAIRWVGLNIEPYIAIANRFEVANNWVDSFLCKETFDIDKLNTFSSFIVEILSPIQVNTP